MKPRPSRRAVALCAAAWLVGMPAARADAADRTHDERRVLATLDAGRERLWRRVGDELAEMFGARLEASWFMRSLGEQCLVLEAPAGSDAAELARRVRGFPGISSASPVGRFHVLAGDESNGAGEREYLSLETIYRGLRLEELHRTVTGRGVNIAVIDTGVDVDHPELAGRVSRARDFVGDSSAGFTSDVHGTAVAGIIAARGEDQTGIVGVAPGADLWALKACWQDPPASRSAVCDSYTLALALDDAIGQGARIINLSLAGDPDPLLSRLVGTAIDRGAVVVAAAEGETTSYPASLPGVLAVYAEPDASRPRSEPLAAFPAGAIVAAGTDLLTTIPRGYDFVSGSSFAAAQVTGVAALLLERRPGATSDDVRRALSAAGPERSPGIVRLDGCAALTRITGEPACPPIERAPAPAEPAE